MKPIAESDPSERSYPSERPYDSETSKGRTAPNPVKITERVLRVLRKPAAQRSKHPGAPQTENHQIVLKNIQSILDNTEGRVLPPLVLWFLGVPGIVCLLLWFFFWRG